jgi:hypothetical protein
MNVAAARNKVRVKAITKAAHVRPGGAPRDFSHCFMDCVTAHRRLSHQRVQLGDLCTTYVQEGGFEGPENGPKQRRINNRLLSYRPSH